MELVESIFEFFSEVATITVNFPIFPTIKELKKLRVVFVTHTI